MADADDDISGEPLSPHENKRVRKLLRDEERVKWFWATTRVIALWVTGTLTAVTLSYGWLKDVVKFLNNSK